MKKLLSLALALVMILALAVPAMASSDASIFSKANEWYATVSEAGTITVKDNKITFTYSFDAAGTYLIGLQKDYTGQLEYVGFEAAACDHDYVGVVINPGRCFYGNTWEYTCTKCGDSYTEVAEPFGSHNLVKRDEAPYIKWETGKLVWIMKCDNPGCDYHEEMCEEHNYDLTVTATCWTGGWDKMICTECGEDDGATYGWRGALGHKFGNPVAIDGNDKWATITCEVCGYETYTALWVTTVVAPNCSLEGYTELWNVVNGGKWYSDYVPALGHDWQEAPVWDGHGWYNNSCSRCDWAGYISYDYCDYCGGCDICNPGCNHHEEHNYEGKVINPGRCFYGNTWEYTCTECGDSYTEVAPAFGEHNWVHRDDAPYIRWEDGKLVWVLVCANPGCDALTYQEVEKDTVAFEPFSVDFVRMNGNSDYKTMTAIVAPGETEGTVTATFTTMTSGSNYAGYLYANRVKMTDHINNNGRQGDTVNFEVILNLSYATETEEGYVFEIYFCQNDDAFNNGRTSPQGTVHFEGKIVIPN